jgi:hypothetical protein
MPVRVVGTLDWMKYNRRMSFSAFSVSSLATQTFAVSVLRRARSAYHEPEVDGELIRREHHALSRLEQR